MSRGEGELLTAPKPRAVSLLFVYLAVKPVGEPDAGDRHVRFDKRCALNRSLLAQIGGTKRRPIDDPVHSADQTGTTDDIAECDRNEIMDNPGYRNK